jgi:hypothetical protein
MANRTRTRVRTAAFVVAAVLVGGPAFGQVDLSGIWANSNHQDRMEALPGPDAVEYLGLPINDEARAVGLSWMATAWSQPERQCAYFTPLYRVLGPFPINMWSDVNPVTGEIVAWKIGAWIDVDITTIWMDGRPHPSEHAFHSWSGFTTGVWEGNTLKTFTSHIKQGWLRRNGVPSSDQATLTQYITRNNDLLTIMAIWEDPIYLTEPYVRVHSWRLDPSTNFRRTPSACEPIEELPRLETDPVPHYLPGENPFVNEFTEKHNIPLDAVLGGADTMYPEYRRRLEPVYVAPERCERNCGG